MKIIQKYASYLALAAILATGFTACKKNNFTVEKDGLVIPDAAAFAPQTTLGLAVNPYTYYVKSDGNTFNMPVALTNISGSDRTVSFAVTSNSAVAGTQYTTPAPLTIKAGKSVDTLRFAGLFSGYPTSARKDTVKIKFANFTGVVSRDSLVVIMARYCDVIAADLSGNYANSTDTYNGGASSRPNYVASISNWTATSATSATIVIKNMGATSDNGWGPFSPTDQAAIGLNATLDWSNPSNFSVTIPAQNYFNDGSGQSRITATGSFSACDKTFTITCKVTYAGNGTTYTHVSLLKK